MTIIARSSRRGASIVVLLVIGVGLAGCTTGITPQQLEASLTRTFTNLYVLQQVEEGHPKPAIASHGVTTTCIKGARGSPQQGAGNDWVCYISYEDAIAGTEVTSTYDLNVLTDGCYSADDEGTSEVTTPLGGAAVDNAKTILEVGAAAHGHPHAVANPLWLIQGCFNL